MSARLPANCDKTIFDSHADPKRRRIPSSSSLNKAGSRTLAPARAFEYILRGAFFGMMRSWIVSLAAHIQFRRTLSATQSKGIPARSPLGKWGSILGLIVVLAAVAKTWFDSRVNLIAGLTMLLGLTVAYAVIRQSRQRSS